MDNRPLGVFDSGLGGLTVVRELKKMLPSENVVYFGDTARVPYGNKSRERIIEFSHQIMHFLLRQNVKAVIVACGTVSSNALDELTASYDLPIIGVVEPGAAAAVSATKNGRIGVCGTSATIRSGAFERKIHRLDPDIQVVSQACPLFVPLVEEGWFSDPVTRQVAARYMAPLKKQGVDTVVLGCTHYPLLGEVIQEEMGKGVRLINVSHAAARQMGQFLSARKMLAQEGKGQYQFYTSDSVDSFRGFIRQIMETASGEDLSVAKVSLEKE